MSTLAGVRRRNRPSLARYVEARRAGEGPPREDEQLDAETRAVERLMLGLRLDEPPRARGLETVVDHASLERLVDRGLVERVDGGIRLTQRGRLLGDGVTAELLA